MRRSFERIAALALAFFCTIGVLPLSAADGAEAEVRVVEHSENGVTSFSFRHPDGTPFDASDELQCTITASPSQGPAPERVTVRLQETGGVLSAVRFYAGKEGLERLQAGDLSGAVSELTVSGGTQAQSRRIPLYALLEGRGLDGASVRWSLVSDGAALPEGISIGEETGILRVEAVQKTFSCRVRAQVIPASGTLEGAESCELPLQVIPASVRTAVIAVNGRTEDTTLNIPSGGRILTKGVTLTLTGEELDWLREEGTLRFEARDAQTGTPLSGVTFGNLKWSAAKEKCTVTADMSIPANPGTSQMTIAVRADGGEVSCSSPRVTLERLTLSVTGPAEVRPGGTYTYHAAAESGYTPEWTVSGAREGDDQTTVSFTQNSGKLYLTIGASALDAAGAEELPVTVKASVRSRDGAPAAAVTFPVRISRAGGGEDVTVSAEGAQTALAAPFQAAPIPAARQDSSVYIRETTGPRYAVTIFPAPSGNLSYTCRLMDGITEEALKMTSLSGGVKYQPGELIVTDDLTGAPDDLVLAVQASEDGVSGPVTFCRFSGVRLRSMNTNGAVTEEIEPEETRSASRPAARPVTASGLIRGDGRLYPEGGGAGEHDINLAMNAGENAEYTVRAEPAAAAPAAETAAPAASGGTVTVSPAPAAGKDALGEVYRMTTDVKNAQIYYRYNIVSEGESPPAAPAVSDPGWMAYADPGVSVSVPQEKLWRDPADHSRGRKECKIYLYTMALYTDGTAGTAAGVTAAVYTVSRLGALKADPQSESTLGPTSPVQLSSIGSETADVQIYYTTDGTAPFLTTSPSASDPNQNVTLPGGSTKLYTGPFTAGANFQGQMVVRAFAVDRTSIGTLVQSPEAVFIYTIAQGTSVPEIFSVPATSYEDMAQVERGDIIRLSCSLNKADIYYTLDGSIPDPDRPNGTTLKYNPEDGIRMDPARGEDLFTIVAMARDISGQYLDSPAARFFFVLPADRDVEASPEPGEVEAGTRVALKTEMENAVIYYEMAVGGLEAPDPDPAYSTVYAGPIEISGETQIKAMAVRNSVRGDISTFRYTLAGQIETPETPVEEGATLSKGSKLDLGLEEGMQVVYTLDGSDPTDPENKNVRRGEEIILDGVEGGSVTVNYYIEKDGKKVSDVESITYFVAAAEDAITTTPPDGSEVNNGDIITLSTTLTDVTFFYTTDGSDPTTSSPSGYLIPVDGEPGAPLVLKVLGVYSPSVMEKLLPGEESGTMIADPEREPLAVTGSTPFSFSFSVRQQTPPPTASIPDGAIILEGTAVELTAPEGDIFYTTDGSDPTESSARYTEPLPLTDSVILKAAALAEGKSMSEAVRFDYTLAGRAAAPRASEEGGALPVGTRVRLTTSSEDARIYYTTNGEEPTAAVTSDMILYDAPIEVSRPVTIKMIALSDTLSPSIVSSVSYTVVSPPAPEADGQEEPPITEIDKLRSRRGGNASGPLYSGADDVQLRDAASGAVLSAPKTSVVQDAVFQAQMIESSEEQRAAVLTGTGCEIAALYDVSLSVEGAPIEPSGEAELGLPIPAQLGDGLLLMARVNPDGTVQQLSVRRDDGMAYAPAGLTGQYALAVPAKTAETGADAFPIAPAAAGGIALAAAAGLTAACALRRRIHSRRG